MIVPLISRPFVGLRHLKFAFGGEFLRFIGNKLQNVTWPRSCCRVGSLQIQFERQEGLPTVSDLRPGFFATRNCTASRLKARDSFYIRLRCVYWIFEVESMNYSCFMGDKSDALLFDEQQHGGTKQQMNASLKCEIPATWNFKLVTANSSLRFPIKHLMLKVSNTEFLKAFTLIGPSTPTKATFRWIWYEFGSSVSGIRANWQND